MSKTCSSTLSLENNGAFLFHSICRQKRRTCHPLTWELPCMGPTALFQVSESILLGIPVPPEFQPWVSLSMALLYIVALGAHLLILITISFFDFFLRINNKGAGYHPANICPSDSSYSECQPTPVWHPGSEYYLHSDSVYSSTIRNHHTHFCILLGYQEAEEKNR